MNPEDIQTLLTRVDEFKMRKEEYESRISDLWGQLILGDEQLRGAQALTDRANEELNEAQKCIDDLRSDNEIMSSRLQLVMRELEATVHAVGMEVAQQESMANRELSLSMREAASAQILEEQIAQIQSVFESLQDQEQSLASKVKRWIFLGWLLHGKSAVEVVDGHTYTSRCCFEKAANIDINSATAWYNLAKSMRGGGTKATVHGREYTHEQCWDKAVQLNPTGTMLSTPEATLCDSLRSRIKKAGTKLNAVDIATPSTTSTTATVPPPHSPTHSPVTVSPKFLRTVRKITQKAGDRDTGM